MIRYDPRADIVFRKIFGTHEDWCISLLNALLEFDGKNQIVSITYQDPDLLPDSPEKKNTIVDVRCTDGNGRSFIAEMQMYWTNAFFERTLLNIAKAYSGQASAGDKYQTLKPVYALCLINEDIPNLEKYEEEFSHPYAFSHGRHPEEKIKGMHMVFVELKKYRSTNLAHRKMARLWLDYLTMMDGKKEIEAPAELKESKETAEAVQYLAHMSLSPAEKRAYERYWDAVSCEKTLLAGKYEEGEQSGKRKEKFDTAYRMKTDNMPTDIIAKYTGLSIEEIESLNPSGKPSCGHKMAEI